MLLYLSISNVANISPSSLNSPTMHVPASSSPRDVMPAACSRWKKKKKSTRRPKDKICTTVRTTMIVLRITQVATCTNIHISGERNHKPFYHIICQQQKKVAGTSKQIVYTSKQNIKSKRHTRVYSHYSAPYGGTPSAQAPLRASSQAQVPAIWLAETAYYPSSGVNTAGYTRMCLIISRNCTLISDCTPICRRKYVKHIIFTFALYPPWQEHNLQVSSQLCLLWQLFLDGYSHIVRVLPPTIHTIVR